MANIFQSTRDFMQSLLPAPLRRNLPTAQKDDPAYQSYVQFLGLGQPIYTPRDFQVMAKEGYERNPTVFRAVTLISQSCAGIPWKLYKKGDDMRSIEEHPLLDLLAHPNQRNSGPEFIEHMISYWILSGNSYVSAVIPNPRQPPTELWCLRPDRMRVIPGQGTIWGYEYNVDGYKTFFDADTTMHLKMFAATNDWYGLSPIAVAGALIDQQNEGFDWNTAILQNAGRPSGALVASGVLVNDQYERLKRILREQYAGKRNAGKPMLLEGGLDWKPFSLSPLELDWIESRKINMRDIAVALGVPSELLGDGDIKTYCLPYTMKIYTEHGPKMIGEVRPGERVFSLEDGKMTLKTITRQSKTGRKQIYKITAGGKTLRTSGNHPFLVRLAEKSGTKQMSPYAYRLEYKHADELQIGDVVVSAYEYPDLATPYSPHPVTEDSMELLGALLGDGFIKDYGNGNALVSIAGIDGEVRDTYARIAKDLFTKVNGSPINLKTYEREVRFVSKSAVTWLQDMCIAGTAQSKRIPGWVFTQPCHLRLAFLRGLFDTDGSVDKMGHISFHVNNEQLAQGCRDLALSCGLQVSNMQHSDRMTKLSGKEVAVRNELWGFLCTVAQLNLEVGSRNPLDQQRLEANAHRVFKGRRMAINGRNAGIAAPEHCEYLSVKAIEIQPPEDVYDIEVEGSHNFFAEHICVHNSNYGEARKSFYQETILPMMDRIVAKLNTWLVPMFDNTLKLTYDKEEIEALQEDRDALSSRMLGQYEQGVITLNEVRNALGLEQFDGGDILMIGLAGKVYIPSDQLAEYVEKKLEDLMAPPAPQPAAAPAGPTNLPDTNKPTTDTAGANANVGKEISDTGQNTPTKPAANAGGGNPAQGAPPPVQGQPAQAAPAGASAPLEKMAEAASPRDAAYLLLRKNLHGYLAREKQIVQTAVTNAAFPQTAYDRAEMALKAYRQQELLPLLLRVYRIIGASAFQVTCDQILGMAAMKTSFWNADARDTAALWARKVLPELTEKALLLLAEVLTIGVKRAELLPALCDRVGQLYMEELPDAMDELLQTYATQIYNAGAQQGALSTGVVLEKRWHLHAACMQHTICRQADGMLVNVYDPYKCGEAKFMYPADAAQGTPIYGCRCYETYSSILPREQKYQPEILRVHIVTVFKQQLVRYNDSERQAVIAAVRHAALPQLAYEQAAQVITTLHARELSPLLMQMYRAIGTAGALSARSRVARQLVTGQKAAADFTFWTQPVQSMFQKRFSPIMQMLTQKALTQLKKAIGISSAKLATIEQIAAAIDTVYMQQLDAYLMMLAETETTFSFNAGGQIGAASFALPVTKMWMTMQDSHVREAHAEAEGQERPLGEPYNVDGEELMHPGDDSMGASSGNTINCRCVENYIVSPPVANPPSVAAPPAEDSTDNAEYAALQEAADMTDQGVTTVYNDLAQYESSAAQYDDRAPVVPSSVKDNGLEISHHRAMMTDREPDESNGHQSSSTQKNASGRVKLNTIHDEHGRFGSGGGVASLFPTTSGSVHHDVVGIAAALRQAAVAHEQQVTAACQHACQVANHGGKLQGLDFRLKSPDSLQRKIATDAAETFLPPEQAAQNIHDALRYTTVIDGDGYQAAAQASLDALKAQGYQVERLRNTWETPGYSGVNVAMKTPDGFNFEMQYHTSQSFATKEAVHPLYEQYRVLPVSNPTALALQQQMNALFASVTPPPGAGSVHKHAVMLHEEKTSSGTTYYGLMLGSLDTIVTLYRVVRNTDNLVTALDGCNATHGWTDAHGALMMLSESPYVRQLTSVEAQEVAERFGVETKQIVYRAIRNGQESVALFRSHIGEAVIEQQKTYALRSDAVLRTSLTVKDALVAIHIPVFTEQMQQAAHEVVFPDGQAFLIRTVTDSGLAAPIVIELEAVS